MWALYDAENRKFLTDFKYPKIKFHYWKGSKEDPAFGKVVEIKTDGEKKLYLDVLSGKEFEPENPEVRAPFRSNYGQKSKWYYETKTDKYYLYEDMNEPQKRFKTPLSSNWGPKEYINSNLLLCGDFLSNYVFLDSAGNQVSRVYQQQQALKEPRITPSLFVASLVNKDNQFKFKYGIFDIDLLKETIPVIYDKIEFHSNEPFLFRAVKDNKFYLLDIDGNDYLSEHISFNAIPYYVDKEHDFCIATERLVWYEQPLFYLYRMSGEKIVDRPFWNYEVTDSVVILDVARLKECKGFRDQYRFDFRKNTLSNRTGTEILYNYPYTPKFTDVIDEKNYDRYYQLQNQKYKKMIKDPIVRYQQLNDSLYILTFGDYHKDNKYFATCGIYDFKNQQWFKTSIAGEAIGFTPEKKYEKRKIIRQMLPGYIQIKTGRENAKMWIVKENRLDADFKIQDFGFWFEGMLNVKTKEEKFGYINEAQEFVIQPVFTGAFPVRQGYLGIKSKEPQGKDATYGLMLNTSGDTLYGGKEFTRIQFIPDRTCERGLSDMERHFDGIRNDAKNVEEYIVLDNGKIGTNIYYDYHRERWEKWEADYDKRHRYNPNCNLCHGTGQYIYQGICPDCKGAGYFETHEEKVSSGRVRTEYQSDGSIRITKYEAPIVTRTRKLHDCSTCKGSGHDPNTFEYRSCWKCPGQK